MKILKYINHSQLKELRRVQLEKQHFICPVLKKVIKYEESVFDHKHKTKKETLGENGNGCLRGVLHFQANVVEGKITKIYKRYGLHKFIPLPELLRNLADYIETPPMKPEYIHPNEIPKAKKIGKRDFNQICKYYFQIYPRKKKLPVFPKSGKLTKNLERDLKKVNQIHKTGRRKSSSRIVKEINETPQLTRKKPKLILRRKKF